MTRLFLIVLDGCGVGALPDAASYGADDPASDTLAHVARAVGGLALPHLQALGLGNIAPIEGVAPRPDAPALWGRLAERSRGKDSVTGHWEMMGIVTDPAFPTWPDGVPADLIRAVEAATGTATLGGHPASGTEILDQLGEEHLRTGKPIVYTSADSVFQVAAHEERFGLDRLVAFCEAARRVVPACRVIARPFVGVRRGAFRRTGNRHDWPLPPPPGHALDRLDDAGVRVHLVGRPGEFFPARAGQSREATTANPEHGDAVARAARGEGPGGDAAFVFANLEDFDMLCGHRNDPAGFARLLTDFDRWLGDALLPALRPGDVVGLTADHGNDPTTASTDHSREHAPLLCFGPGLRTRGGLGVRESFADWGAGACRLLGAAPPPHGNPFL